jgi:hypothetical protein
VREALIFGLPKLDRNRHDRARVVFLAMCSRAKDSDTYPQFFGGSAELAHVLGFEPDDPAGERAVERAIKVLVDAGLVAQIGRTSARGHRRWALNLQFLWKRKSDVPTKGTTDE